MRVGLYCKGKNHTIEKYFQIFEIFDRMIKDSRFEPVLLFDGTGIADDQIKEKYSNIKFYDLRDYNINNLNLNAVIVICPYSKTIIPYKDIKVPIIYKEYGVAGVEAGSGYLLSRSSYRYADMIITDNEYMKEMILSKYPDKYVVKYSPAFDYIFSEKYLKSSTSSDRNKVNVLWTPHHSVMSRPDFDLIEGGSYSTFPQYKDYLINEFLKKFPDVILHIKYHPILSKRYNAYCKENHIDDSFSRFIKRACKNSRVKVYDKVDFHDLFAISDICINDSISFIQEYLPTMKPMFILESKDKCKYSEYGEKVVDNCHYRIKSKSHLEEMMNKFINNQIEIPDSKLKFVKSLYYYDFYPNSDYLLDLIESRYGK